MTCQWCGEEDHAGVCPRIAAMEFGEDGITLRRIEFVQPERGPQVRLEDEADAELRARLKAVIGSGSVNYAKVDAAVAEGLDELAGCYSVFRRKAGER